MKPLTIAVLTAFLVLASSLAQSQDAKPPVDERPAKERVADYLRRAKRLADFGRPLLAQKQLDLAAQIDPSSRDVMLAQLRLFTRSSGEIEGAAKWAQALAKNFPDDYESCFEIATYLFISQPDLSAPNPTKESEVKAAIERLEAELAVFLPLAAFVAEPGATLPPDAKPNSSLSLAWLARASLKSPRTGEVALLAAKELDVRAYRFAGFARLSDALAPFGAASKKLYEAAAPLYRRAFTANPEDLLSRAALCNALFCMGKFEEARKECEITLLASGPRAPVTNRVVSILIDIATHLGDLELLLQNLEKRHKVYDDIDSALDLSAARRISSKAWPFARWREYRVVFEMRGEARLQGCGQLLEAQPDFLEVHLLAAEALVARAEMITEDAEARSSWYKGALEAVARAGELTNTLPDASRLKALAHWHLGQFKESAEAFGKTAELDPDDGLAASYARAARDIAAGLYTTTDFTLMGAAEANNDFKQKRMDLTALTKRAPKYFDAWLALGEVSYLLRMFQEAAIAYDKALELSPDNLQALYGSGHSRLHLGELEAAQRRFEKVEQLRANYRGITHWIVIVRKAGEKGEKRKKALARWLESKESNLSKQGQIDALQNALAADESFAEALIDLAVIMREQAQSSPEASLLLERAEKLLASAYLNADDDTQRASARLELGRVRIQKKSFEAAAADFEAAFALEKSDGFALMMAALARRALGDEAGAGANMRRLYAEVPGTLLLRPSDQALTLLDLGNAKAQGARHVTPSWNVGDKRSFDVQIEAAGEGGAVGRHVVNWACTMHIEVASTPTLSGTWKLIVTFSDITGSVMPEVASARLQVEVSPWFGLVRNPLPADGRLANALDPAVTALCEVLCMGLGDSPIMPDYAWRNDRTQGPPRFDAEDSLEATVIEKILGDTTVVRRVAAKGRYAGGDPAYVNDGGRVDACAEIVGERRVLRKLTLVIDNEQLAASDDDVLSSRLSVTLKAK
ncbi:MAG: tetratricopeptide repeat protein [Planctomycetes bacterium]|nr:tetratricopeptide repeat protein [Planctomycetota bacterium]